MTPTNEFEAWRAWELELEQHADKSLMAMHPEGLECDIVLRDVLRRLGV